MTTAKTTIVLELNGHGAAASEQLIVTLERPALFTSFRDFQAAMFGYSVFVTNHLRRLSPDNYVRLGDLSEEQRFIQAVLTGARELAYVGHEQGRGQPVTHRIPLGDDTMQRILARGGVQAVARLCDSFRALFVEG